METKVKIITHDRVVHADDVFAAAILRLAYGSVEVLRTRDPHVLREEAGKPDTFLLDVGGRYEPSLRLFDHHQTAGAGFRDVDQKAWPYATAGLVWKHYGQQAVKALHPQLDEAAVMEIVEHVDDVMLRYIDAVDCGVRLRMAGPSLSALIGSFNNAWYEDEEDVFPLVLDLAQVILTNFIKRYAGKVYAREKVRQASYELEGRVLVLEGCFPWVNVVAEEMPEVLFVVYPVASSASTSNVQWQIRAAEQMDNTLRIKLPPAWGGLERDALANVCGVPQAAFCHRSRHLAGAYSLEAALAMAECAIHEHFSCELEAA